MTLVTPEQAADDLPRLGQVLGAADAPGGPALPPPAAHEDLEQEAPVPAGAVSVAAFLSAAAAGLAAGAVYSGWLPKVVGVAAAGLGAGMVWLSSRSRRPAFVQAMILPLAAVAGALLVLPATSGGSANLPSLVAEALRTGGVAQPPVPFDPGWRFLLVVALASLGAAAAALGWSLNRPKVAVFLPVPVVFGSLLTQTGEVSVLPTVGAFVLVVGALTVSFGAELAREGATSAKFELRRFARGAGLLVVLVAMLGGLTQVGFLFPASEDDRTIPPQRPKAARAEADRELFVVQSERALPWRIGVLDGYDGRGWLTPPYTTKRLLDVPENGAFEVVSDVEGAPVGPVGGGTGTGSAVRATFTVSDVRGHLLPAIANLTGASHSGFPLQYDPRTQALSLPEERARKGMTYTVEAPALPKGSDLVAAPPPPEQMRPFLDAPAPPPEVSDLLEQAPQGDLFTRLQFVRRQFYAKVVARGAGQSQDVPPERVVELLAGEPGTPFEITAAEALLARWVGVPARLGFGYLGGDPLPGGRTSLRPKHGATWMEAYFQGYGWLPIVGTPPRAQSSLNRDPKNASPSVRPSQDLTLPAYVPVRVSSPRLLYLLVQYWAARTLPYLLLGGFVLWLYPGVAKLGRRWRRQRWARRGELAHRVRVAYTEWRDLAHDFNVGHASLTPLEFVGRTEQDVEHAELAWLVTRCLWGDLARDLRESDVLAAEEMSRSLMSRLRSVQPASARLAALASRNSLRDPYSDQLPNLWWPADSLRSRVRRRARAAALRVWSVPGRAWAAARTRPLPGPAVLLLVLLLSGCVQDVTLAGSPSAELPARLVPPATDGVTFQREPSGEKVFAEAGPDSLVGTARVYSVRSGDDVVGALQAAAFKTSLSGRSRELRAGVLEGLGGGQFRLQRLGDRMLYVAEQPDQQLFLYFPEQGSYYELFIARRDFTLAAEVFLDLLAYQSGDQPVELVAPPSDPRRGFPG